MTQLLLDPQDEHLREKSWPVRNAKGVCIGWRVYIGSNKKDWLHRVLLSPGKGMLVDHANGNVSDNRRGNIRVCSRAENKRNGLRHKRTATDVPFKGVYPVRGRFRAIIRYDGKNHHLGYHQSAEQAARAYDAAAAVHFGAFACLNFPLGGRCAQVSH